MLNNITQIPAPRVALIDERTGLMSREWYRFFINLFNLTGDGSNTTSLTDLQVGPPSLEGFAASITYADLAPRDELGTLSAKNSVSLTTDVSGILPIANGGTNSTATPTAGGVIYGTGTAYAITAAGTTGQILTSNAAGTPTWSSAFNATAVSTASVTSPLAWDSSSYAQYALTALANALTINADANAAPVDGQKMTFRIKDNGTARALTWTTGSAKSFRVIGTTLPTTTVVSKIVYVGCIYNAADSRWDVVAVGQEV
jgi:hypothetical protein